MVFLFEKLEVYKKAMGMAEEICLLEGKIRDKVIKDQIKRAVISIVLNLAEGQGRLHGREKRQFYNTSRGSLLECIPLLQLSKMMGFLDEEKYLQLYELANEIGRMLTGL